MACWSRLWGRRNALILGGINGTWQVRWARPQEAHYVHLVSATSGSSLCGGDYLPHEEHGRGCRREHPSNNEKTHEHPAPHPQVTLYGYEGEKAPVDNLGAYLDFAASLPDQTAYRFLQRATFLTPGERACSGLVLWQ